MNLGIVAWVATAVLAILKLSGLAVIGWWTVFSPVLAFTAVVLILMLIAFLILVFQ